jgi:histidinol phosphatase-like PHP family hydrolase
MHDEFIELVRRYGKVVEINVGVMLLTAKYTEEFKIQYLQYLAYLKESGVRLSIGTDCHTSYDADLAKAEKLLNSVGIKAQDLWKLTP